MAAGEARDDYNGLQGDSADATERKVRILRRSAVFARWNEGDLRRLAQSAGLQRTNRRRSLQNQPDKRSVFVLGSGRVRVVRTGHPRAVTIGYFGPGDVVGETALIQEADPVELLAIDQVEALRLSLDTAQRLLEENATFASELVHLMGKRRQSAERRMEAFLTRTVESRVAEFLLETAERYGVPDSRGVLIGVRFTHQEVASYVGSTRETVTVILAGFKRDQLVITDHRRIIVSDPKKLAGRL